ncbi:hypothetical protein NMG60_11035943 [Bertholletia excelsa]
MCKLCVIQIMSRRVGAMLPWLVIPLIGLWAFSQLLPPSLRFEITSPRLACVFVLLVTLFWYEILMPQLSAWAARRSAWLRERKRFEAIEMHKLRKTAIRSCRNCLTPYRDQNPGGGRFMCTYCGHISKRPVMDLPVPAGLRRSHAGILKNLVGEGSKILKRKVSSDNGWTCNQVWSENSNCIAGPVFGKSGYWLKNEDGCFGGDGHCIYSGVVIFTCKILTALFLTTRWLWGKITRVKSPRDHGLSDAPYKGSLPKPIENGTNFHESKEEKARRKAEEKRQARLEREMVEEEERKQKKEVARLVEEQRRLRDEKIEAEKELIKDPAAAREKGSKKEAERKCLERKKVKDKGSSKSKSDARELDKRSSKESEQKCEFGKRSETTWREQQRTESESAMAPNTEMAHGNKGGSTSRNTHGNTGKRYFDHMKGTFLSSSKAFTGGGFYGKNANNAATVSREDKPNAFVGHIHTSPNRTESSKSGKPHMNVDEKIISPNTFIGPQQTIVPKKSWQQLFTCSSVASPPVSSNVISRPSGKSQADVQSHPYCGHSLISQSYDNPITFGLPSPFVLPTCPTYPLASTRSSAVAPLSSEGLFRQIGEAYHEFLPEKSETFEYPSYVPELVSLLGPVSESLDNFQLDGVAGFATDIGVKKPPILKNRSAFVEVNRPSPIEFPMSRIPALIERHSNSDPYQSTPKAREMCSSAMDNLSNAIRKGTWQMWSSSPLGQDGMGLVGAPGSPLISPELDISNTAGLLYPMSHKLTVSQFVKGNQACQGGNSLEKAFLGHCQNGQTFATVPCSTDGPWPAKTLFRSEPGDEGHFSLNPNEDVFQNGIMNRSPNGICI